MNKLEDLDGITAARAVVQDGEEPVLTLTQASGFHEDRYYPAESLTISGTIAIAGLLALCTDMLRAAEEQAALGGEGGEEDGDLGRPL